MVAPFAGATATAGKLDGTDTMSLDDELLALERKFWIEGADFYRENLDEQRLVVIPELAGLKTREEVAASVAQMPRWLDVAPDAKAAHRPDRGTAILTYQANARRNHGTRYRALVNSLYVERVGGWKMAFHQQTSPADH